MFLLVDWADAVLLCLAEEVGLVEAWAGLFVRLPVATWVERLPCLLLEVACCWSSGLKKG